MSRKEELIWRVQGVEVKKETDFSSVVIRQGLVINIHLFTLVILSDACEKAADARKASGYTSECCPASGSHDARGMWATNKQENLEGQIL